MKAKNEKVIVALTIDKDVLEATDETAEGLGMSRSAYINMILSGARDSRDIIEKFMDKLFDRKKSALDNEKMELKAKLVSPSTKRSRIA